MAIYFGDARTWMRRAEDGSFPSWWDGLYVLDEKIADYIVAKTDAGWTGSEGKRTEDGFEYRSFSEAVKVSPGKVEIRIDGANVQHWEIGIDIRHIYANRSAEVAQTSKNTILAREKKRLVNVTFNGQILNVKERLHTPIHPQWGPKPTKIYVVKVGGTNPLVVHLKRVPIRLVVEAKRTNTAFESGTKLDKLYEKAKITVDTLRARKGFYAGLPWFTQYWGRDFLWSVPALLREGYTREVREGLLALAYNMRDGEVPRLVMEDGEPEFGSIDANPLFIHGVYSFSRIVDPGIVQTLRRALLEAWGFIDAIVEDGAIVSRGHDTWMDTLAGKRYPIDVVGLWYRAAVDMERMGLGKGFSAFVQEMFEAYRLRYTMERSPNILVAAMCRLVRPRNALQFLRENGLIGEGVRTLSPMEVEYSPKGYHTGSAWGLTTGWGLFVSAMAGDWELFWRLADVLLRRGKYLDECWDSMTGEQLGADVQLWSGALVIRTIDEVIIDQKRVPKGVAKIRRIRWGKGGIERVTVS